MRKQGWKVLRSSARVFLIAGSCAGILFPVHWVCSVHRSGKGVSTVAPEECRHASLEHGEARRQARGIWYQGKAKEKKTARKKMMRK